MSDWYFWFFMVTLSVAIATALPYITGASSRTPVIYREENPKKQDRHDVLVMVTFLTNLLLAWWMVHLFGRWGIGSAVLAYACYWAGLTDWPLSLLRTHSVRTRQTTSPRGRRFMPKPGQESHEPTAVQDFRKKGHL